MNHKQLKQNLVSFKEHPSEFARIQEMLNKGWAVVNFVAQNYQYVVILEDRSEVNKLPEKDVVLYVPPRKKITIW